MIRNIIDSHAAASEPVSATAPPVFIKEERAQILVAWLLPRKNWLHDIGLSNPAVHRLASFAIVKDVLAAIDIFP